MIKQIEELLKNGLELFVPFNKYTVGQLVDPDEISSTPNIKPTTLSPRLLREKPVLYKGIDRNGKAVAIKAARSTGRQLLINEWKAASRLNFYHQIPFIQPVSPRLLEDITDLNDDVSFYVFEWLNHEEWKNISTILQKEKPLIHWENKCAIINNLRSSMKTLIKKCIY